MLIDSRRVRARLAASRLMPPWSRAALVLAVMLPAAIALAQAPATAVPALADEEIAVSTGSWYCDRYLDASAAPGSPQTLEILTSVRQFALGYVYGVSEAVGRPFPESSGNQRRILALFGKACSEDTARAVRDATLLAGRAMLADGSATAGATATTATGALGCGAYLEARKAGGKAFILTGRTTIHNWADGYINARFERAGRGLIPTAKNKALMLARFSAACAGNPGGSVRDAARSVVVATLPGK